MDLTVVALFFFLNLFRILYSNSISHTISVNDTFTAKILIVMFILERVGGLVTFLYSSFSFFGLLILISRKDKPNVLSQSRVWGS